MGTKDFEDEKHQMSSGAPLLTLRQDWRQKHFQRQDPGRFFYQFVSIFQPALTQQLHSSVSLYCSTEGSKEERLCTNAAETVVSLANQTSQSQEQGWESKYLRNK